MPTPVFAPRVLADVLVWQAQQRPQALALRFLPDAIGLDISYLQLQRRSERAAARLWHQWGVRPGDRVAWLGLTTRTCWYCCLRWRASARHWHR